MPRYTSSYKSRRPTRMAYRRRAPMSKRKASYPRRTLPRRLIGYGQISSDVRGAVEQKFYDNNDLDVYVLGDSNNFSTYVPMVNVPGQKLSQGSGNSQRIGQRISVRSLQIRAHIRTNGKNFSTIQSAIEFARTVPARLIVVLDKQANGAVASIDQVLLPNGPGGDDYSTAFNQLKNAQRFVVLRSKLIQIPCQVVTDINGDFFQYGGYQFEETIKFPKGLMVTIDGPDGIINEFTSNQLLCWVAISTEYNSEHIAPPAMETKWVVEFMSRVRYTDQ